MNPEGRKPDLHPVDGQMMTVKEIAKMLGVSTHAIACQRCRMGGVSYQVIVNMYRNGQLGKARDHAPRYMIHGRWMTTRQMADELGVGAQALINWRNSHKKPDGTKPIMEEVYDRFRERSKSRGGSYPAVHRVQGRKMTVAEAAKKYHTTVNALRVSMSTHRLTLDGAVKRLEARRAKNAEKEIMDILGF